MVPAFFGEIAESIGGGSFMPAHLRLIRLRVGMKRAPTKHRATILVRLRVLRQFQMPVSPICDHHAIGRQAPGYDFPMLTTHP